MRWFALLVSMSLAGVTQAQVPNPVRAQLVPFLKTYCFDCHGSEKPSADLNLLKYDSPQLLATDFRVWEHVAKYVKSGEMPPVDAEQPKADERAAFLKSLQGIMHAEAAKAAGDPGVILPRRLSNAEYNYTIRDLTGVDIRPADAFPIDPASGEGFSNTGEALLMSPGLFKKYYAAAQQVADHIDFTPTGWSFAPYAVATYADQKKLHEQRLLDFYDAHAVKYEVYLTALRSFQQRPVGDRVTVEQWASERQLSPKYLRTLHDLLNGKPEDAKYYVRLLRERWQAISTPEQIRAFAKDIETLSKQLCPPETPAIVGNAGNAPIQHIERRQKTAAARDTFNPALLSDSRRLRIEYRDVQKKETVRVVLNVAAFDSGGQSVTVILRNLNFTSANQDNYRPNDEKRNVSLAEIVKEQPPAEFEKLGFGKHPQGKQIDEDALVVTAGNTIELDIKTADLPEGNNISLFVDAQLDREHSTAGAVRVQLLNQKPGQESNDLSFPLVNPDSEVAKELKESCGRLCEVFPNRFFFVDGTRGLSAGFHLIEGFFRDDEPLCKHVLSSAENDELNRLWEELNFGTQISARMLRGFVFFERSERNFMKHKDFDSFKEEDPELTKIETVQRLEDAYFVRSNIKNLAPEELAIHPMHTFFADIRDGLQRRQAQLLAAQPTYLQQIEKFATSAFRRPLTEKELSQLRAFFEKLSSQPEHGIEQAVRASIIRILVSPHFCYRIDPAPPGDSVEPLTDLALASRLSYFLWSSQPDEELLSLAKDGKLRDEKILLEQTRRMLKSPKVSAFALEFFGPWLRYRDFLEQESISREVFPQFDDALKQAMFEEPTRVTTRLIQQDRPLTELLSGDSTLVNKRLAQHYNVPFTGKDGEWVEVTGLHEQGRSGLLGMAVFLTKNSQPQRTSPVKRGFWVVHHLLGEHIPPPPPGVVALPAKETDTNGKTIRQLLALHVEDAKCSRCHVRFDGVGLAMEGFDAIGRSRKKDLAGREIDNLVKLPSGKEAHGVPEFAEYLAAERVDGFADTLNRKFLGYALGRSLQLSDQPLLDKMQENLRKNDYRFGTLFDTVVLSPQFRNQRCRDFTTTAYRPDPASNTPK